MEFIVTHFTASVNYFNYMDNLIGQLGFGVKISDEIRALLTTKKQNDVITVSFLQYVTRNEAYGKNYTSYITVKAVIDGQVFVRNTQKVTGDQMAYLDCDVPPHMTLHTVEVSDLGHKRGRVDMGHCFTVYPATDDEVTVQRKLTLYRSMPQGATIPPLFIQLSPQARTSDHGVVHDWMQTLPIRPCDVLHVDTNLRAGTPHNQDDTVHYCCAGNALKLDITRHLRDEEYSQRCHHADPLVIIEQTIRNCRSFYLKRGINFQRLMHKYNVSEVDVALWMATSTYAAYMKECVGSGHEEVELLL